MFDTPEAARDSYVALVMSDLNTRLGSPPPKVPKRSASKSPEDKPSAAKKVKTPKSDVAALTAAVSALSVSDSPKKAKSPKAAKPPKEPKAPKEPKPPKAAKSPKEPKVAKSPKSPKEPKAPKSPKAAKSPKSPKKAAKAAKVPAADLNLVRVDATWRPKLKAVAKKHGAAIVKETEAALCAYLNTLSKEDFNAKSGEEHVADFLTAPAAPSEFPATNPLTKVTRVEFEGKDYYVNLETKRIYEGEGEQDDAGNWTHYEPIGYVGMEPFVEMVLPA